jgi:hypothetical protein
VKTDGVSYLSNLAGHVASSSYALPAVVEPGLSKELATQERCWLAHPLDQLQRIVVLDNRHVSDLRIPQRLQCVDTRVAEPGVRSPGFGQFAW